MRSNIENIVNVYNTDILEKILKNQDDIISRLSAIENSKVNNSNEYLSIQELMDFLPQKPALQTIYGWVSNRLIPYKKASGKLYFKRKDIEHWLNNGKKVSYMKN